MNRKTFWLLAVLLLISFLPAEAQQPTKVPRIGYLTAVFLSAQLIRIEAFRQGLRELGYVEGKNIVVEYRYAEGKQDRVRELADELARLKVDIVVSAGPTLTRAAKKQLARFPLSWRLMMTPSETASSPASRGLEETLLGCPTSPRT